MRRGSQPVLGPLTPPRPHDESRPASVQLLSWIVLLGLLAALLVAAVTFDPRKWPSLVGDEASYLMAAQSLARDFDVRYQREDLDRFVELYQRKPEGLILQSPDHGATLVYGKPLFYPIFLAPFLRVWPVQGPAIANALLLALASILAARALRSPVGAGAPLWIAVLVFASATFAHVFWAHSDLFVMSLIAIALSLLANARAKKREVVLFRRASWRWLPWASAGVLLAVAISSRPFYAPLLLPLAAAAFLARQVRPAAIGVAVALVLCLGLTVAAQGTWTTYAGERLGYYSHTGFPLEAGADSDEQIWQQRLQSGDNAWVGSSLGMDLGAQILPFGLDLRVASWNVVYLLIGRHVGLLVYFLPLLLCLVAFRSDTYRWSLLLSAIAIAAAFLLARPFNFWGGGGALANRYLLPVYPVFWFLIARRRGLGWPILVALLAAPFLWPLWSAPRGFLRADDGSYRHVSKLAEHALPYETTQSHLKPGGREDFHHGAVGEPRLWIKPLSPRFDERDGWIELLPGDHVGTLLIGFERPLRGFVLTEGIATPNRAEEAEAEATGAPDSPLAAESGAGLRIDGRALRIEPLRLRARHRMWWSRQPFFLYQLDLDRQLAGWRSGALREGNGSSLTPLWFRITAFE